LILVSGATGSGKSTTLAALVNAINVTRSSHIITIEDPIEYLFEPEMSVFSQREVGVDVPSFKVGVKNALRQRPDVIAIGEIVDRETAETALIASDSGHLVLGTIHANSAISTIHKLLSFFDSQELENKKRILAGSLLGIVSQVLLPSSSGDGLVLASELLLNHSQRFSRNLFEPQVLQNELESRADKVSQSMGFSLLSLIKCGAIDAQVAHRVPGLAPDVYKQIRALM
jgi:twitching motility protein PilT